MTALAEWHFGKGRGRTYCDGCAAAGAACATTRTHECSYHEHRPRGDDGRLAWQAFTDDAWRINVQGMGLITGVDTTRAADRLQRFGMDRDVAADLLAACEVGLVRAYNEKDEPDGQQE